MAITNRLSHLMKAQRLTTTEVAARIGKHEATVARWRKGQIAIPEKYWAQLAAIFGVSVAHLLGLDEDEDAAA